MAASIGSETRTASTCAPVTARGTHLLKIAGYSLHKGLGVSRFVRSATFAVGGYHWSIRYYPDGIKSSRTAGHVVVYLELMSEGAEVRALFAFSLLDQATGQATAFHSEATPVVLFSTIGDGKDCWGTFSLKKSSELEASSYLRGDCLTIQCDVTVIKEPRVEPGFEVQVPPSDLLENLGKLLDGKKGADVTFKVRDELFPAHKILLAMRSPVFDAELYGPMAQEQDTAKQYLTIEDMDPEVFRALLHFVYRDSMPSMEGFDASDSKEMARHLLVAADRYAMERLKVMCEGILCRSLGAEDVATSLALADMHQCHDLRNACVAFTSSLNKTDTDVASHEYMHIKRACSAIFLDFLNNMSKWMLGCLPLR